MKYINRQTIAGFIGNSPELRYMPNGQAVIELRVATAHSWKDRANNQWHKETEWHNCVAYRDDAEKIAKIYTKGDAIYIEGRTRTREWEAKDKSKRSRKELMIELHNKIDDEGMKLSADDVPPGDDDVPPQTGDDGPAGGDSNDGFIA